ncbi:MAG: class II fumarate hydratase [Oscillospiraceae bacterium]|nr:class II fumarate hydratase [Candidatus Ruminococcus equi]
MDYRIEHDTMGEVKVPIDKYYGAQTQRSFENFRIGEEKMPFEIISAFASLKSACAKANLKLQKIDSKKAEIIETVCDEIKDEKLVGNFPLSVWQTGSGTQTNMNVNEVIANRGNEIAGEKLLHPNDDVNMSQSSNDTFPSAMNIAATLAVGNKLLPALYKLIFAFSALEMENVNVIKIGRTHLQDATPIKFSQEISGWRTMLSESYNMIEKSLYYLRKLAIGGTAVGTGLNAPENFDKAVCDELSIMLDNEFVPDENKFHALTSKDAFVFAHGAIKSLACNLMKIANDIRFLSSGPRCGIGEITIPENEPGSSIMPGKVNPTQCEAVTMVAVQVMANDTAISISASQGNFELNVFMPVCAYNFLQSVRLLTDVMTSFEKNCVRGIKPNEKKMKENLDKSLMLVTCLTPKIGYEKAAQIAKYAHENSLTLKEAVLKLEVMSKEEFDILVDPKKMV